MEERNKKYVVKKRWLGMSSHTQIINYYYDQRIQILNRKIIHLSNYI